MARSVASNHDDKRQKILDAAAALFASSSFESARLQDVAAACNTSKSALYHYFPSKEVLLHVIIIDHCRTLIAGYKVPRSVEFSDGLPLSGAGKTVKNVLREPFWRGRTRSVN